MFDQFLKSYLECALGSEIKADYTGTLDEDYGIEDISEDAIKILNAHALVWWHHNGCFVQCLIDAGIKGEGNQALYSLAQLAGHDLWLTQNGHGTGFWDRSHWGVYQESFTKAAEALGEFYLYEADGKIEVQ